MYGSDPRENDIVRPAYRTAALAQKPALLPHVASPPSLSIGTVGAPSSGNTVAPSHPMTRILYLDDSGKPESQHASRAVVLAGFAIDAERYPALSRRILGAKGRFYPGRGIPQSWEIKSSDIIKPNPWRRRKNRDFCSEVVRLLRVSRATTYAVTIAKSRMNHPMTLSTSVPLQLQILAEHFAAECETLRRTGIVIADWSGHQHDQHVSECVASFVASCGLPLHPAVYYGSSHSTQAIQVADLIAGVRRRRAEGDGALTTLDSELAAIRPIGPMNETCNARPWTNYIAAF